MGDINDHRMTAEIRKQSEIYLIPTVFSDIFNP